MGPYLKLAFENIFAMIPQKMHMRLQSHIFGDECLTILVEQPFYFLWNESFSLQDSEIIINGN